MLELERLLREFLQLLRSIVQRTAVQIRQLDRSCRTRAFVLIRQLREFLEWAFDVVEQYVEHWLFMMLVSDYVPCNRDQPTKPAGE